MAASIEQTHGWLQSTLSADKQQRQAAEEALKQCESTPEHVVQLFRIAADSSVQVEEALRQAAAVRMKSVISRGWDPESASPLGDADKAAVRDNLVEAMVFSVSTVRTQLGLCLRSIAQVDYPDRWPGLVPAICTNLQQQQPERLYGALFALRTLVKVYEFRQPPGRKPLHDVVEQSWPLMGNLLGMLIATPSVQGSELALLAMKIFWSATQINLPPLLMRPDQLQLWMQVLLALLEQPLPPGAPADLDAAASWKPWKVKKRVAQILHRLLQRYGNPPRSRESAEAAAKRAANARAEDKATAERAAADAQAMMEFAQRFSDEWAARCLRSCLGALSLRSAGVACPDRVVTLCLNYVEECIKYKVTWGELKPQMQPLLFSVIFPLLCFNERDQTQWDEDPTEYVRQEFDVVADFYNPRTAATSLLIHLTGPARGKETLPMVVAHCSAKLTEAQGTQEVPLLSQKEGALLALGAMHERLYKKSQYSAVLEPMLYQHVLPELDSQFGFMRSRAAWTFGQFAKSIFAEGRAADAQKFGAVFSKTMACMRDAELPVRVHAALAINAIVESNCAPEAVLAVLPQLVEALFALMNDVGNEEVVQTLDNLIERYGEQMAPYAVQVVGALAQNFLRLFDETEEDDDDDALAGAAMWVMQAISTMMEAVSDKPECFPQMEVALLPLLRRMMGESARDHFEDVNEVLSYLTYYSPTISDELWGLFPLLHEAFHVWAFEYVNNLLVPIDNFISRSTDRFVTGGAMVGDTYTPYLQMVVSICRATLTTHADSLPDDEQHGACKLLESVLHNCRGRIDAHVPEILGLALARLEQLLATEEGRQREGFVTLLYTVLSSAMHYNPLLALQLLQHRHATSWQAAMQAWMAHLTSSAKPRLHDLKCGVLAVAALLGLRPEEAPAVIAQNPLLLVQSGVKLLQAMDAKRETEKQREAAATAGINDDDDEPDDEDDDDDELDDDEDGGDDERGMGSALKIFSGMGGAMASDFFGDDLDDDELEDEEMYSSPLDSIDELIAFTDAVQTASTNTPSLLALAGLAPAVDGAAVQLSADDSATLHAVLAAGVAKKAAVPLGGAPPA